MSKRPRTIGGILHTFRRVYGFLPRRKRTQFWLILSGLTGAAFFETLCMGAIAFYAASVADPTALLRAGHFADLRNALGLRPASSPREAIAFLSAVLVGMIAVKNSMRAVMTYLAARFSAAVEVVFGEYLLSGFLTLPYKWHLTKNSADTILAVQWRKYVGRNFLSQALVALSSMLLVIFMLGTVVVVRPRMTLAIILVLSPIVTAIYAMTRWYLRRIVEKVKIYNKSTNRQVTKAIHGLKDIKVSGTEEFFLSDFRHDVRSLGHVWGLKQLFSSAPRWILECVGVALLSAAVCAMHFRNEVSLVELSGVLALFTVTAWKVLGGLSKILSSLTQMHLSIPFMDSVFEYLDTITAAALETASPQSARSTLPLEQKITLEDVSFSYADNAEHALRNISFCIPKGQTTGIIGTSGAGKSTLVDLMIGVLRPTGGRISVDDAPLDEAATRRWICSVGYVPQDPYIYDGTLAQNVAFGFTGASIDRERVLTACRMAAMDDFLYALPSGIDSPIGERGVRLSGGQKQRVAIARALYGGPEVIIFDEATSSLDPRSEQSIQDTIYALGANHTLILIAHRLSTVERCNQLVWIDGGQVRKIGPPREILGEYRDVLHGKG